MSDGTIQFSFHPLCTQISGWNHQITGVSEGHLTVDPFEGFWNQTRPALHIPVLSHSVVKKWSSPFDVDTPHRTADAFECSESRFVWNSLTEQHRTLHQGSEDTFSSSSCYCQVWDVSFCIHQAHYEEDKSKAPGETFSASVQEADTIIFITSRAVFNLITMRNLLYQLAEVRGHSRHPPHIQAQGKTKVQAAPNISSRVPHKWLLWVQKPSRLERSI